MGEMVMREMAMMSRRASVVAVAVHADLGRVSWRHVK